MICPDGISAKWIHNQKTVKILLFTAGLLISAIIFWAVNKPPVLDDLSNGIFPETFRTSYRPLQNELKFLHTEGFFSSSDSGRNVPVAFTEWYTAPETQMCIGERVFSADEYGMLIRKSLRAGLLERELVFADPLENPVPGDLFRTLLWCFNQYLKQRKYTGCVEFLEYLFCYSSILLSSNAAESYFVAKSVECGKLYEGTFSGNRNALLLWRKVKRELSGKYLFSMHGIYRLEQQRIMGDFEKIRTFGIRIFDEKPAGSFQFWEGVATFSCTKMKNGISTSVTDYFYDVDRDQTMTLSMLRRLLYDGITPAMLERPDRKMSIRCFRRITGDAEILSSALHYLNDSAESGK